MLVKGTSSDGKHVKVNEDFSILIKKPSIYIDEFADDKKLIVMSPKKQINNYKEGTFSIDDETPINGKIELILTGSFTYDINDPDYDANKVLKDYDISSVLKKLSSEAKNVTMNISVNGNYSRSVGEDTFKRMYKVCVDTPTLKSGYYTMGVLGKTTYVSIIATTHALYTGTVRFTEDDDNENEKWLNSLLESLKPLNVGKSIIEEVELKDLEKITYSKDTIDAGSLVLNKANELDYVEKEKLPENFDLIATSKSFKNKIKYNDAPIGICIYKPNISDAGNQLWKLSKESKEKTLIENFRKALVSSYGSFDKEIKLFKLGDNYAMLYAPANSSKPDEPYWASYSFFIAHDVMLYVGMIYYNCNKPKESDIENNIKEFLNNVKVDDKKTDKKSKEEKRRVFGQFGNEDGKIDAIKVNNMFYEDIVFNNPEEIVYKNKRHSITGLQLNSERMNSFPNVRDNFKAFLVEIDNVMEELENNEKLIVNVDQYHKNFYEVTRKEPITGIIYLLFAAWHMIKIVEEKKNSYKVLIDENLILGLPNGYSRLMEYIKSLRKYNGITEDFDAEFIGTINVDGPTSVISNPVDNSDTFKPVYKMNSKDINLSVNDISNESNDLVIRGKVDINILKYLNHEIPIIYKDIQRQVALIEKNKQNLLKHKDMRSFLDALMDIHDDDKAFDFKVNMSFVGIGGGGTFSLIVNLDQLNVDIGFHPNSEYRINYEYSYGDNPKEFIEELIKLYKSKTEIIVRKDIIKLINGYLTNGVKMSINKEKMFFNSKIYDYDTEDKDFKEEDFYKPLNSKVKEIKEESNEEESDIEEDNSYDDLIELMKDGKKKMKTEVDGFHELVEDKLRPIRYDEDSYDLDTVVKMVESASDDFGNNASQTVELMDKSAREPMESCKNEEVIKNVARTILDTIKFLDKVTIRWGFRDYYPTYSYSVPGSVSRIKHYWMEKYENLDIVKKEKAEQKVKEEEQKKNAEDILKKWEKEVNDVKQKIKNELDNYTKLTRKKYDEKIVKLQKKIEDEIEELESNIEFLEKDIEEKEEEISMLGMFSFSKRTTLREMIDKNSRDIEDLKKQISKKENEKDSSKASCEEDYKERISNYEKELLNKYPLPKRPKDSYFISDSQNEELTEFQKENIRYQELIFDALVDLAKPVTVSDLLTYGDELPELSNQRMSALLKRLVDQGRVTKDVVNMKAYFSVKL